MRQKKVRTALCLLLVGTVLAAFVAIAADVGSQSDPLVTLSYLNDTFLPSIMEQVDEKLTATTASTYQAVTLADGQTLYSSGDCEVLLRSGSAAWVGSGAADLTGGESVSGGALTANHLYLLSSGQGVRASGTVTLLVRGSYSAS